MCKNSAVPLILVESPVMLPSVKVGVLEPLTSLERRGKLKVIFKKTFDIVGEDIKRCDILISVRGCEKMSLEIVKCAREYGRFIIYYLDDDLLNLPETAISKEFYERSSNRENLKRIIYLADVFWTSNTKLIEKYCKYGNCHLRSLQTEIIASLKVEKPQYDQYVTKILYAGSVDHTSLAQKYIIPALRRIVNEYEKKVEITFIGITPQVEANSQIKIFPFIEDYNQYRMVMETSGFDIGLGIIDTDEFYQCKYYNKFIEYASIGAAGIFTKSLPYTNIVTDKENGLLVNNDVKDWYTAIKQLIDNTALRKKCISNARTLLCSRFDEKSVIDEIVKNIPELEKYKAPGVSGRVNLKNGKIVYLKQRFHDYWEKDKIWFILNVSKAAFNILLRNLKKRKEKYVKRLF